MAKEGNLWKSELHLVWIEGQVVSSGTLPRSLGDFHHVPDQFFLKMTMSSAIPVTPGTLRKIASSFHWNTSCAMMEPIGSLVHWKPSNV